jgi:hypothetical protein
MSYVEVDLEYRAGRWSGKVVSPGRRLFEIGQPRAGAGSTRGQPITDTEGLLAVLRAALDDMLPPTAAAAAAPAALPSRAPVASVLPVEAPEPAQLEKTGENGRLVRHGIREGAIEPARRQGAMPRPVIGRRKAAEMRAETDAKIASGDPTARERREDLVGRRFPLA